MTTLALNTAFDPSAPAEERRHAMSEAQAAAIPSSVTDMLPLVEFIQRQNEEQEFSKALAGENLVPFPSRRAKGREPGMQSVWLNDTYGNSMGEWRERWSGLSFDMMRSMVDQTPVLSSVILTRQRQVKRFCRVPDGGKGPGFQVRMRDHNAKMGKEEEKSIGLMQDFFTNCGWERNPRQRARLRRENFSGLMGKLVRDSLIMDSAPIETEWKRDRSLGIDGLYAVDGATIRLVNEIGYRGDDEIFAVQVIEGNVRAAYSYDDLIYVPRNPRTDVLVGGYGMSETELLIKVVTGFLNAFTYNTSYFDKNAIPKGLLHLTGDYDANDLSAFRRYWNAMVKGVNNAWTLPVMVSKNQESKANFENFGVDVNEMMFTKWMTFLTSIICAIYGIAPDEINFESFTNGTSSLSGSDTEEKLINSKDKGLRPLLAHFEDLFSDYIVSDFGDKYMFRWTGMDEESPDQRWAKDQVILTVNEARKDQGRDEIKEAWGEAPLNQNLMQAWMAEQQAAGEDYGDPDADGAPGAPGAGGEPGAPAGGKPAFGQKAAPATSKSSSTAMTTSNQDDVDLAKAFGLPVFTVDP